MAAHFKDEFDIPFTLLVDHTKETYRALEFPRANAWNTYGPPVWIKGVQAIMRHRNKMPKQDAFQLGGAVVVDTDGSVRYIYRSKASSDQPPVAEIIAAL